MFRLNLGYRLEFRLRNGIRWEEDVLRGILRINLINYFLSLCLRVGLNMFNIRIVEVYL